MFFEVFVNGDICFGGYGNFIMVNNLYRLLCFVILMVNLFLMLVIERRNEMLGASFFSRSFKYKDFGFVKRLYKKRVLVYSLYGNGFQSLL